MMWLVRIGACAVVFFAFIGLFFSVNALIDSSKNEPETVSDNPSSVIFESEATIYVDADVVTSEEEIETTAEATETTVETTEPEAETETEETTEATEILPEVIAGVDLITVSEVKQTPTISAYGPGEEYYYDLSEEDKIYIAKVVYQEARGESFEGQVAVAAVILNRYVSNDSRFSTSSIYSVVTQSGQFASIDGVTMTNLNAVPSCMEAVEAACKGWDPTRVVFEDGAKFFFNPDGDLSARARYERNGVETYQIGNHLFHNEMNA